ncbi:MULTISPECIES: hypothetical protein [unclassified Micromonospora]|uniref:hypothetical protein n=1 Tax=unclassified Micromonospora TaxID=2617518 RepID=UPI0022B5FCBC|nr:MULTISPECIES: hypothetical protein [unclassified Micromonospora]MCZ7423645.1 hypothetical protein [Verrucosispora sp. WMMA2121]WBB91334.1 hypothetical protein O7597_30990 [Verrucosispora sp. WMMC514]
MASPNEEKQGEVGWFCVRCVFRVGGDSASQVYEERLTLWRVEGFDEAIALAEDEALGYAAEQSDMDFVGLSQAYRLFDEPGHGAEVFSLLRASDLNPPAYLTRFFDTGEEKQGDTDPGT